MGAVEDNLALVHQHAVHEHRRQLPELLATVHPDAVYEDVPRGLRWEGRKEVEAFYAELLAAFPDLDFQLVARRGGPDHVTEELLATGTHRGLLNGIQPTNQRVRFRLCIVFPMRDGLVAGETVYYDLLGIYRQLGMLPEGL